MMTNHPFRRGLRLKLLAIAATALVSCPSSCMAAPEDPRAPLPGGGRKPVNASPSRVRSSKGQYPDPRYRPPKDFSELQAIAGQVAKSTRREIHWRLALGGDPGPLATIRGGLDNCTIHLHPLASRKLPPNIWAFIIGHEFAHLVENLGTHSQTNPTNELKADIAGARYAMAAGYRIEAFLGWVLTEPNHHSKSHGSPHERVYAVASHFRVPRNVIHAEAQRYLKYRATH